MNISKCSPPRLVLVASLAIAIATQESQESQESETNEDLLKSLSLEAGIGGIFFVGGLWNLITLGGYNQVTTML